MLFFFKFFTLFFLLCVSTLYTASASTSNNDFYTWLKSYKQTAIKKGISQETIDIAFKNVKFLEQVIIYDRKQPEFYEDTDTYVNKRATDNRSKTARKLLKKNRDLFIEIEDKFHVEKEILLALWGIETNFGKHVGKMDIISSLATLSYDKRRSEFFSSQLFILLKLIDDKLIDPNKLYGSWAGAYGNFQFMPSTISRYAIDYDGNYFDGKDLWITARNPAEKTSELIFLNVESLTVTDRLALGSNPANVYLGGGESRKGIIYVGLQGNMDQEGELVAVDAKTREIVDRIAMFVRRVADGLGLAAEQHGAKFFGNDATPDSRTPSRSRLTIT